MAKRLFDHMRERLLFAAGVHDRPAPVARRGAFENWSARFEQLMRNRLAMGALRYGHMATQRAQGCPFDVMGAIRPKLKAYARTGNSEYLVDAANYLMLVFELDPHPNKHFNALDDHHDHCKPK